MEWFKKVVFWTLTAMKNIGIFIITKPWLSAIIIGITIIIISTIIILWKRR